MDTNKTFRIGHLITSKFLGVCRVTNRTASTVEITNRGEVFQCEVRRDNTGAEWVSIPFYDGFRNTEAIISSVRAI